MSNVAASDVISAPQERLHQREVGSAPPVTPSFVSARDRMAQELGKRVFQKAPPQQPSDGARGRSLGGRRRFVPPVADQGAAQCDSSTTAAARDADPDKPPLDERLKNFDEAMIERIESEIIDRSPTVHWDDIAGLEFAKKSVLEVVIWPMLRPDIFTGLRGPPKGVLLFGPPGTGKTLIGKAIASESNSTFFSVSASTLTSKWVGEGEKMVRALFAVAAVHQPSVVFIDEIDSLLCQRSGNDFEASRRLKTEFLIHMDGAATNPDDRVLIVGATNRPQELDEAVRRRLVKRLYIPLPTQAARRVIVERLVANQRVAHSLTAQHIDEVARRTEGYSGADMHSVCREAAMGPIRNIHDIRTMAMDAVRPIGFEDFDDALRSVRPSVASKDLQQYIEWNETYGTFGV
eukprot:TRINITY_DN3159_c0_g1_i2.p1 TRINITY_DN3159_c0_g1~~TRINITY_DN3159_c0_g1_i2.p1  ORF type:complete len:405 (+),score=92.34 TRINITY_DN3159_c0_g1_i2:470-1684(+)